MSAGRPVAARPAVDAQDPPHARVVDGWGDGWPAVLPALDGATRARLAATYAAQVTALQAQLARDNGTIGRPLHRKAVFAAQGTFRVRDDLHPALRHGVLAVSGVAIAAQLRFSNAAGRARPDSRADLRGLAVRLTDGVRVQDLLATNYPTSHARDTADFMAAANLTRGVRGLPAFLARTPPHRAVGMVRTLAGSVATCASLADETYYARAHFQLGSKLVEFRWAPAHPPGSGAAGTGDTLLTDELIARVRAGALRFRLELRGWVDEAATPTHDGRLGWSGPWTAVGTLEIAANPALDRADVERGLADVDSVAYSIGNRWDPDPRALRGRGLLNEFREEVYAASQAARR